MNPIQESKCISEIMAVINPSHPTIYLAMKLFYLLSYSKLYPNLNQRIGIYWINDEIFCYNFRINQQLMNCRLDKIRKLFKKIPFLSIKKSSEFIISTSFQKIGNIQVVNQNISTEIQALKMSTKSGFPNSSNKHQNKLLTSLVLLLRKEYIFKSNLKVILIYQIH
jgi:hypothetical protein